MEGKMRRVLVSVSLAIILLSSVGARADKVTSDYDHTVDFSKYRTFMWIEGSQVDEPFMKDRIMRSVTELLTSRGLRQVHDGADLAIGVHLATEEKHTWETYYSGSAWGWGSSWSTTEEKIYQVGTLTVDLFDTKTNKLVWQGVSTDTLSSRPEHRSKDY